jgi:alkanesulfonate monooxygenase SsuD/methylene tetrahydromethanopterin reductase-like flavin-dependent oxidoreductase (luciferase family)
MPPTTMLFDMRSPEFGTPLPSLYAAALEMASYVDRAGLDRIWVSEHHGSADNYLPSPFVMGAAVAARTGAIRICLNAVVLPLHDPVEIAEQIGVLDLISQGRLEIVFGAGYVPSEFARFGVALAERARRMDDGIELILRALSGERFERNGREVFVRPLPMQRPRPTIYAGGGVDAAARRAARFDLGFVPMRRELLAVYEAECRRLGREPGPTIGPYGPAMVHVAEDPERARRLIEPHVMHHAATYARWAAEANNADSLYQGLEDARNVWQSGRYRVVTPDQCVDLAGELDRTGASLVLQPQIAGLAPEIGWTSLELFATKVLPLLRSGQPAQAHAT